MVRNNKGLSLVELIVAIAILAVAGIAIFGFVSNTSNAYSRTNKEIKLQYEQQMAVNQIRDIVVGADKSIYYASNTLVLCGAEKTNPSGAKSYPVSMIYFDQANKKITFASKEFTAPADVTFDASLYDFKLLSDNVKDFKVDLSKINKDKVQFEVTFIVGEKEQTAKETVALRNRLVESNDADTIWGGTPGVVESFIQGVTITRGAKTFANGDTDSIGKYGESVSVQYKAVVTANAESTRNYEVNWTLKNPMTGVSIAVEDGGIVTVTVKESAQNSGVVELHATCLDDATKTAFIKIQITNYGVYPKQVKLEKGGEENGNGYRVYTLIPTVVYTDTTEKSDLSLVIWDAPEQLPSGCSFDSTAGKLILSSNANGKEITIRVKAKERSATNEVLSAQLTIKPTDIPEYATGPSVSIAVASTVSRGSYIFPTMVFKNTTDSSFTYKWKVEPYHDTSSTEWDTGEVSNSDFKLISLSEEGGYNEWNVRHEMETSTNKRTIALSCAEWLNWNRTFKVKIRGTATDKDGKEYVAPEKIVTINPVEITIEKTDVANVDPELWKWDDNNPILTDSVLRYEDWYWYGLEKGSEAAKWKGTRRWFIINCRNISLNGTDNMGCTLTHNYQFRNQIGTLLSNDTPYLLPYSRYMESMMLCGFMKEDMIRWEQLASRPAFMNYSITMRDSKGNSKESNVENFSISYKFYEPDEE